MNNKLKSDDFLRYKFLSGVTYSPDRKQAAFMMHRMYERDDRYLSDIWLWDQSGKYRRLTSSGTVKYFIWLTDKSILFADSRSELIGKHVQSGEEWTEYYLISTEGGEASLYMALPSAVSKILPLRGGKWAVIAAYDGHNPNPALFAGKERIEAARRRQENQGFELLDEIPFWADGASFTSKLRSRIYIYDRKEKTMHPVTDELTDVCYMSVKDDRILYVAKRFENVMPITEGIYEYDCQSGTGQTLLDSSTYHVFFAEYIEGKVVFAGTDMKRYGTEENPFFYRAEGGQAVLWAENQWNIGGSGGSDSFWGHNEQVRVWGDCLYFTSTEHTHMYIKKLSLDGTIEKLNKGNGSIHGFDAGSEGIIYAGMRDLKLQELYLLKEGDSRQLTAVNERILKGKTLSHHEALTFSCCGDEVEGFVLKPVDFDEKKKYPAILTIHGGPKSIYSTVFHHVMQYWATQGYFVFFCNSKGSEGRGNEFADVRGRYGAEDYQQLMKFTDLVLDKYSQIDPERLGVTGISYGGFMTNWIIGHTDRFRCAISEKGISCHISDICANDIGYWFTVDQLNADPWTNVGFLWDSSPLKYASNVKTPTMFIQGENDYRCWLIDGLQMFTALKYFKIESKLWIIKGASHLMSWEGLPAQRVGRLTRIMDWFDEHLK